jgi:hypothetical protein
LRRAIGLQAQYAAESWATAVSVASRLGETALAIGQCHKQEQSRNKLQLPAGEFGA